MISNEPVPLTDSDADNKLADADLALQALGGDHVAFGYLTTTITVADASPALVSRLNQRYAPLLNLARLTGDAARARLYGDYALRILDTLTTPEFLAVDTPGWEGILKHGSYHERKGLGVDESVMWGEYFFCEALDKLLGAPLAG